MKVIYHFCLFFLLVEVGLKSFAQESTAGYDGTYFSEVLQNENGTIRLHEPLLPTLVETESYVTPAPSVVPEKYLTIALLGRSGAGVSSTVRELVGPKHSECKPEGTEFPGKITEYTVSNDTFNIRLLDIPGLLDGRHTGQDSKILASLKAYFNLVAPPDFYVAISRFDENRFDGENSMFARFLKRVELFYAHVVNTSTLQNDKNISTTETGSKILYLLTHLMSDIRNNQRKPWSKINSFRQIIEGFTRLPHPITVVVGDNKALDEHEVPTENGYYKLPNKQLYPKNVWEALISLSSNNHSTNILTAAMKSREAPFNCQSRQFSAEGTSFDGDTAAFSYLLQVDNSTIYHNEINQEIQRIFQNMSNPEVDNVQKVALQLWLQQQNITKKQDFPKSIGTLSKFYQNSNLPSSPVSAQILRRAFGVRMPEYTSSLIVGYGYDVMSDEMSSLSPFLTNTLKPSSVGYQIPNFVKCEMLLKPSTESFQSNSANKTEYVRERLKYLDFTGKENISQSHFTGTFKEGFNVEPDENENMAILTAVKEYRKLSCVLEPEVGFMDPDFVSAVNSLSPFDKHSRDSVNEWENWFGKWGTHTVSQAYGGGRLHGSLVGPTDIIKNVLEGSNGSAASISNMLTAILELIPLPLEDFASPAYRVYGGERNENSENLYKLEASEQQKFLLEWDESLRYNFIMLNNQLRLEPISALVTLEIGQEKGEMIEQATNAFLRGELKYTRKKKSSARSRSQQKSKKQLETTNDIIAQGLNINETEVGKPPNELINLSDVAPTPQQNWIVPSTTNSQLSLTKPEPTFPSSVGNIMTFENNIDSAENQVNFRDKLTTTEAPPTTTLSFLFPINASRTNSNSPPLVPLPVETSSTTTQRSPLTTRLSTQLLPAELVKSFKRTSKLLDEYLETVKNQTDEQHTRNLRKLAAILENKS